MVAHRTPATQAARMSPPRTVALRLFAGLACAASAAGAPGAETAEPADIETEPHLAAHPAEPAMANAFAFTRAEAAAGSPRVTVEGELERIEPRRPLWRQGGLSTQLVEVSNRVWLGWGRAAFGVGVGLQSPQIEPPLAPFAGSPMQPVRPSMSFGLRYRVTDTSSFYAGASAARAWSGSDELPLYRAKAGIEWKAARSRLGFDGGRLGLQLDSGYRMSIRTRSGGLQIALRGTF